MKDKIICFDLDGTLTVPVEFSDIRKMTPEMMEKIYEELEPNKQMIEKLNQLAENNLVYIYTARDDLYQDITIKWLKRHGVNYKFVMMKKPFFDMLIDDKAIRPEELWIDNSTDTKRK
jgi:uncharacterized HAD superfamily protein